MKFSSSATVRNDLLQDIVDNQSDIIGNTSYPLAMGNPKCISYGYSIERGPHSETALLAYEVPANKRAVVKSIFLQMVRTSSLSVKGRVYSQFAIDPPVGSTGTIIEVDHLLSSAGTVVSTQINPQIWLESGDYLRVFTLDSSTGGLVHYQGCATLQEFDA